MTQYTTGSSRIHPNLGKIKVNLAAMSDSQFVDVPQNSSGLSMVRNYMNTHSHSSFLPTSSNTFRLFAGESAMSTKENPSLSQGSSIPTETRPDQNLNVILSQSDGSHSTSSNRDQKNIDQNRQIKTLPVAHTCFQGLDWDGYSSDDLAEKALLTAITYCRSIDTDQNPTPSQNGGIFSGSQLFHHPSDSMSESSASGDEEMNEIFDDIF